MKSLFSGPTVLPRRGQKTKRFSQKSINFMTTKGICLLCLLKFALDASNASHNPCQILKYFCKIAFFTTKLQKTLQETWKYWIRVCLKKCREIVGVYWLTINAKRQLNLYKLFVLKNLSKLSPVSKRGRNKSKNFVWLGFSAKCFWRMCSLWNLFAQMEMEWSSLWFF